MLRVCYARQVWCTHLLCATAPNSGCGARLRRSRSNASFFPDVFPAAIAAALSLAVDLVNGGSGAQFGSAAAAATHVAEQMDYLVTRWAQHSTA